MHLHWNVQHVTRAGAVLEPGEFANVGREIVSKNVATEESADFADGRRASLSATCRAIARRRREPSKGRSIAALGKCESMSAPPRVNRSEYPAADREVARQREFDVRVTVSNHLVV
jgi:hypothetical protein